MGQSMIQNIKLYLLENNTGQIPGVKENPRDLTGDGFAKAKQSIKDFPEMLEVRTLVVVKHGEMFVVIGGNQRLRAMRDLDYDTAPVMVVDWPVDKINEFIIKDNIEYGVWNFDLLANEWDSNLLVDWGMNLPVEFGDVDDSLIGGQSEVDDVPEAPEVPKSKLGDIWICGKHRVMCGDSTSIDAVEKLMDGQKADMVFTDPPYGMKKEKDGVLNDNLNFNDLLEFNRQWVPVSILATKDNGSWYCWGIDEPLMDMYSHIIKPMIASNQATFRNLITWDKGNGQGQNSELTRSYAVADEKCLFIMLGVQGFDNNSDNYFEGFEVIRSYLVQEKERSGLTNEQIRQVTSTAHTHYWSKSQWLFPTKEHYETIQRLSNGDCFKKQYDEIKKQYYSTRAYFNNTHDNFNNVWHFDRHQRSGNEGGHATPKPIPLCERGVLSSSRKDEIVLDVFGGSGSTLIACEQLNRKCYMMELDPKYCDVIVKRWQDFTGKDAILESTQQKFNEL